MSLNHAYDVRRSVAQASMRDYANRNPEAVYSDLNGAKGLSGGRLTFARNELVVLWPPEGEFVESVVIPGYRESGVPQVNPTQRQLEAQAWLVLRLFINL